MSTHHQAVVELENIEKDKQSLVFASIHCVYEFLVTAAGAGDGALG